MAYSFRGQYEAKTDTKSRLAIPAGLRTNLPNSSSLVITNSLYRQKKCLDVYSLEAWEELEKKISQLPSLNANIQAFQRFYLSAGQEVSLDSQNRILIPKGLRDYAGINNSAQLVGMGDKFEIWDLASWKELSSSLAEDFENILAGVAALEEGE